ncbi:MAG: aldolase/citrate lyase family protein [Verrucomicrobiota bacterium]
MLARNIKKKLASGEPVFGGWMSLAHPSIGEIFAQAGFDWVLVETEHTAIDNSQVLPILMAIEAGGAVPLVRLASVDPVQAKAMMDSGVGGIFVPLVNNRDDAELSVKMAKYPPQGIRGVGLARAHRYGVNFKEYIEHANEDSLVVVQIEDIQAVECIDEILSVEGVDVAYIGPYDLSMSMGLPGQLDHPEVKAAMDRILESALKHGVAPGLHMLHPEQAKTNLQARLDEGYRFIAMGSDLVILQETMKEFRDLCPR